MRRLAALAFFPLLALLPAGCQDEREGALKVVVIGTRPTLKDPASGPLTAPEQILLANVAQGLVRFDPSGNIVAGLAGRWTVSDDGLSYIFRLAPGEWPNRRKITAEQVARALKRQLASRSENSLKDNLGAIQDIVAMTDRVIEITLVAPRPDLLALLAQPQMAIIREGHGTGPFIAEPAADGEIRLSREILSTDDETTRRQQLLLTAAAGRDAIRAFAAARADLVLGGTFADLPWAQRAKLPRNSLRFDPASGLFGLVPMRSSGALAKAEVRQLLSRALDRDTFVAVLAVPGLSPRATLLEPGLDGNPALTLPPWAATPYAQRVPALQAEASRLFGDDEKPTVRVLLPQGPGADLLLRLLQRDWGRLGLTVERTARAATADFALIDEVAPSSSGAWFVRRFRCSTVAVCDRAADELMDAARQTPVPAQRYAFISQAAALIDAGQLFIPITAPTRWSLVSGRVQNFAGNRYARHTLTDVEAGSASGG